MYVNLFVVFMAGVWRRSPNLRTVPPLFADDVSGWAPTVSELQYGLRHFRAVRWELVQSEANIKVVYMSCSLVCDEGLMKNQLIMEMFSQHKNSDRVHLVHSLDPGNIS